VAAVLFFFGPLTNVVTMTPLLAQVNVTVDNLRRLEALLDDGLRKTAEYEASPEIELSDFRTIVLDGICFTIRIPTANATFPGRPHRWRSAARRNPVSGWRQCSGKTTFLKLFTLLYWPSQGAIRVDDRVIGPANIQSYRNLFSAIFSDFHLFDKLHGLREAAPERVNALAAVNGDFRQDGLRRRALQHHASVDRTAASACLVVSYLEDKPVYVFRRSGRPTRIRSFAATSTRRCWRN